MWSARLDVAQVSAVDPFIPLAIGAKAVKSSTATLHKFHILHLDLARVLGLTGDALRQYVYARLCEFIELYEFSLVLPEFLSFRNVTSGGMISYLAVKMDVELGGKRLYVIVENYESSKEKFSGELPEFYMELQCSIWTGSIAGIVTPTGPWISCHFVRRPPSTSHTIPCSNPPSASPSRTSKISTPRRKTSHNLTRGPFLTWSMSVAVARCASVVPGLIP
ncbi:hypothetical protein C8R45DRAFT_278532 [Mycena sanguinolenta]|nr:hypothetical protein C8R45DRAFT_278532 [Mycena sanguinolenta]